MKKALLLTAFLISLGTVSTGANAQKIYRCGSVYSQTPCPDAVTVEAVDTRTSTQQQQARQASVRDRKAAAELEKAQANEETATSSKAGITRAQTDTAEAVSQRVTTRKNRSGHTTASKQKEAGEDHPDVVSVIKPKRKAAPPFTAQIPTEKKEKKKTSAAKAG